MKAKHLKPDPSKTILWASGTSTEVFIHPPTGNFQTRDFLFRTSTATVEAEETVFTRFPNITRTLMVLKGNLNLIHADHHTKSMRPFDQDKFQGDWDTKSKGSATNFNLMCKDGASGTVKHLFSNNGAEIVIGLKADYELFFLQSGKADYEGTQLEAGDCLEVEEGIGHQITLLCKEGCNFIQTSVNLRPEEGIKNG